MAGKMWMRTQCYKLKKRIHFIEVFIRWNLHSRHNITCYIYVRYKTSRNKAVKL